MSAETNMNCHRPNLEIQAPNSDMVAAGRAFIGARAGEERQFEITPGVKMTFCWCPAGDFLMGSHESEKDRFDDEDQVLVTLTKGFWMAKTQVTQAQWLAVMDKNPSGFKGENLPVDQVSWHDTQEFFTKLNARIGNADGGQMSLPTEAQWEYACRAGEKGRYSGGTIEEVAWYRDNSRNQPHPVGTKKPNAWGLHDMHGNVWEWCADWYDSKLLGRVDPSGPDKGAYRVFRGGSWDYIASCCRAANRHNNLSNTINDCGFRVARSAFP